MLATTFDFIQFPDNTVKKEWHHKGCLHKDAFCSLQGGKAEIMLPCTLFYHNKGKSHGFSSVLTAFKVNYKLFLYISTTYAFCRFSIFLFHLAGFSCFIDSVGWDFLPVVTANISSQFYLRTIWGQPCWNFSATFTQRNFKTLNLLWHSQPVTVTT